MGLAPAPVSKVQVRFWMKFHVEFGQSLRLVGGSDLLGAWDIDKAPDMTWSDGDLWSLTLEFNPGSVYEYKYVIMENGQPINWQRGANNVLAVQAVDKEIEVYDNWRNAPGAVVLVDGVETTREHKLLAWANDVSTVHTELRRYREELSKAKEEVRMMRAEMSMQQLEVQEARQRSAALERENQDLRQAMASTQAQAHAAMHEAARLLEELPPFEGTPVPKGQQPEMAYAAAGAGNNGNGRGFWDRW